jgi:hypothetical protein
LPTAPGEGVTTLSWAPDSQRLTFRLSTAREGSYLRVLDTRQDVTLGETPILGSGESQITVDGVLGDTGEYFAALSPGGSSSDPLRVVALDPVTLDITRDLFRFPGPCCGQSFASDTSGRHVLGVAVDGGLYRWSEGEDEPTKIADGVTAAVWVAND